MTTHSKIFIDGKLYSELIRDPIPRVGETLRLNESSYAKVTEVIWCLDEDSRLGQRVNIRAELEKESK